MTCAARTCLEIVTTKAAPGTLCVVSIDNSGLHYHHCLMNVELNILIEGKPHENFGLFVSVIAGLGALGSFTYAYALKDREKSKIS